MNFHRFSLAVLLAFLALISFQLPAGTKEGDSPGDDSTIDPRAVQTMDYHDVTETVSLLTSLDLSSGYVDRRIIGYSYDYQDPGNVLSYPIYALRISDDALDSVEDNHDKNSILIECGMHPREWLASESCLLLAEYLVDNRTNDTSGVPELLDHVDVWIIPITTPSGRAIDDQHGGSGEQERARAGAGRLCHLGFPAAVPDTGRGGPGLRIRRLADHLDPAHLPGDHRLSSPGPRP